MTARPDTAARNASPEHRAAVRAGQRARWARHRIAAGAHAERVAMKRTPKESQAEINARAVARRAVIAAAKLAATIAPAMSLSDWKREYQLWAADLREAGDYIGPAFGLFLPRARLARLNRRLGYPPPAKSRRGEMANDTGHKVRRAQWADAIAGTPLNESPGLQPSTDVRPFGNSGASGTGPAGRASGHPSGLLDEPRTALVCADGTERKG